MYTVICKSCIISRSISTQQELELWLGQHTSKHMNDAAGRGYASSTLEFKFTDTFILEITEIRA